MFLKEYEGRELFKKYGIPVADGVLLRQGEDIQAGLEGFLKQRSPNDAFVVKAQLLSGKRGKSGGILFCDASSLPAKVAELFNARIHDEDVRAVLVQEKISIAKELYISATIDRFLRRPVLIFSTEGGMEIEEIAESRPDRIVEIPFEDDGTFNAGSLPEDLRGLLSALAQKMFQLLIGEEAILAEINPLILTPDDELIAVDSKIIIDNNALTRHPRFSHKDVRGYSSLELRARQHGLSYVELEGDVAVIGNGAGLVMATLDAVDSYGGRPANFCDVGGGASSEMVSAAMDIVLRKRGVKTLFINVFGGITHGDEVAKGIVDFVQKKNVKIPVVIRIVGTHYEKAHEILREAGLRVHTSFEKAAKEAASLSSS